MSDDSMLEVFLFENLQLLEKLEGILLEGEKEETLSSEQIDEVFRIMHTIKGSSSMMSYNNLYRISHSVEDLFALIRDRSPRHIGWGKIFSLVLGAVDFIKSELSKLQSGQETDGDPDSLIADIHREIGQMSGEKAGGEHDGGEAGCSLAPSADEDRHACYLPCYKIKVQFEEDCKMEQIRALGLVKSLEKACRKLAHQPEELESENSRNQIVENGFVLYARTGENPDALRRILSETLFLKSYSIIPLEEDSEEIPEKMRVHGTAALGGGSKSNSSSSSGPDTRQNFISVNVNKLDSLLDIVGELVTTEAMVTKNPDLSGLQLDNFETAARQLRGLTSELQSIVMSIRMLPLSTIFHKMQRLVRDMSKKLSKEIDLILIGEETEVDKNIIDNLSDPLMHLIRNAVDHGIEKPEERLQKGKAEKGRITLQAKNVGEDVIITVSDDGRGLDRKAILRKAKERGLISRAENEITDKEAYSYIFTPGFSTKTEVSEFSGRGVGMDVVRKNIEKLGGTIFVESRADEGTVFTIRIPLTLAILDGMRLTVGDMSFIVPMLSIREAFVPDIKNIFYDPDGNEMIMLRGECYPITRLYEVFHIGSAVTNIADGILLMIESDASTFCILVDQLIGEQQVVVKPFPEYIQKCSANLNGISGCTILGDGRISLIINVNNLYEPQKA